jgi:hypothetical protein
MQDAAARARSSRRRGGAKRRRWDIAARTSGVSKRVAARPRNSRNVAFTDWRQCAAGAAAAAIGAGRLSTVGSAVKISEVNAAEWKLVVSPITDLSAL